MMLKKESFNKIKKFFIRNKKFSFMAIGLIHGFTNMGGIFLSIFSILNSNNVKNITRSNIAYGYFSMGVIQLLILLVYNFNFLYKIHYIYILLALIIYFPSQYFFKILLFKNFNLVIALVAFSFGIFVFVDPIFN